MMTSKGNELASRPWDTRAHGSFWGHQELIKACWDSLQHRNRYISIVGLPGSGKTALLSQLLDPQAQQAHLSPADDLLILYIDCQGIETPEAFLGHVSDQTVRLWPACPTDGYTLPIQHEEDLHYFLLDLPKKVAFLLDNVESLGAREGFEVEFFSFLRVLATDNEIPMITTSCQRLMDCVPQTEAASEFANIFTSFALPPLGPAALAGLVSEQGSKQGANLLPHLDRIEALSGRLPYLVHLAASGMAAAIREADGPLSDGQAEIAASRILLRARPHFERIWSAFPADVQAYLIDVAQGRDGSLLAMSVARLEAIGLLRGQTFFCEPFANFVRERARSE